MVRDPARLPGTAARVVTADLAAADPAALRAALDGADAVLSGLSPRSRADAGVASRGTRVITEAMAGSGVRRIVVVSAAPVGVVPSPGRPNPPRYDEGDGPLMRFVLGPAIRRVLRHHYMLALLDRPDSVRQTVGVAR